MHRAIIVINKYSYRESRAERKQTESEAETERRAGDT